MNKHRTELRLRRRRLAITATFVAVFALASGSVAMAATGYARMIKAASHPATSQTAPSAWQPTGCVFPAETTFVRR